ncbi:hypothetical protein PED39_00275 [Methanomassiliicoccales archaeon LGM-RCC1]|nr:hypothetical protein [Candidatus Methanomethylophilaceae archaeon]WII07667.1 hypothetical protein PED39_00275 [Methanomassiliicoccales archaeon LGM-RCC1]
MGINIGICEMEAKSASCRELRSTIIRVHVDKTEGFEDILQYEDIVDLETAKKAVGDWDAFIKRNRINEETDAVYMSKVKKDEDIALLQPLSKKVCTGWIAMEGLPEDKKQAVLKVASKDDIITGWDQLEFDEMNEMCAKCPLSWDKGRGCIGAFGPDTSKLPEIAAKYNCPITASAPESSKSHKIFTPKDAEALLKEVEILRDALPKEGKVFVNRYGGPVDRMEAVAKISVAEGCGWYFF